MNETKKLPQSGFINPINVYLLLVLLLAQVALSLTIFFTLTKLLKLLGAPTENSMNPPTYGKDVSADNDPSLGDQNAPVNIIMFADFECPYCKAAYSGMMDLLSEYPSGTIRFVYRDFPLESHLSANKAALAAECANEQNKFWKMSQRIFDNQTNLTTNSLKTIASELAINIDQFNQCFDSKKYYDEIQKDKQDGVSYGVFSTPTFFINGTVVIGGDIDKIRDIINQALAKPTPFARSAFH